MIFQSYPYAYLLFYIDSCILLFIWYFYVYFNAASWQSWLYYLMVVNISLSLSYNLLSQFLQALNISYYQFFTFINNIIMVIWIGFFPPQLLPLNKFSGMWFLTYRTDYFPKRLYCFILPGAVDETSLAYRLTAFDTANQTLSSPRLPVPSFLGFHLPLLLFFLGFRSSLLCPYIFL